MVRVAVLARWGGHGGTQWKSESVQSPGMTRDLVLPTKYRAGNGVT
jgi:hypothetical protein